MDVACAPSVEGHAIDIGGGILAEDLLDDPPDGGSEGDVVMGATDHSRVQVASASSSPVKIREPESP